MPHTKPTVAPPVTVSPSYPPPPSGGDGSSYMAAVARKPLPARGEVHVVLVGLDKATLDSIDATLTGEGGIVVVVEPDLDRARAHVEKHTKPTVLVVEIGSLEKRLAFPPFVHVVAIAGPERDESLAGLGVAHELIRRPVHADDLKHALIRAAHAQKRDYQPAPEERLREVLEAGKGGELVVRSGALLARVHVEPGGVAWVHCAKKPVRLADILAPAGIAIADDTVTDIVQESRSSRRHFGEVIVEWAIAERAVVRECLRKHIAAQLCTVFAWPDVTCAFIEDNRISSGSFAFGAADVLAAPKRHRVQSIHDMRAIVPRTTADSSVLQAWLARIGEVPHVLGCALLDTRLGRVLGSTGALSPDVGIAWEMAAAFTALGAEAEEALYTTPTTAYLVRSLRPSIAATSVIVFDPRRLSPAMARIVITKASSAA